MQQCGIIIFFKAINAKLVICCGYETWEERNEKEKKSIPISSSRLERPPGNFHKLNCRIKRETDEVVPVTMGWVE